MPNIRAFVRLVLLLLALPAAGAQPPFTMDTVQQRLAELAAGELPEAERLQASQQLERTLQQLRLAKEVEVKLAELREQVAGAPKALAGIEEELRSFNANAPADSVARHGGLSLQRLESLLADRSARLAELQQSLNLVTSQVISAQTAPERVQGEISANQARLKTLRDTPSGAELPAMAREAEIYRLETGNQYLLESLSANNSLQELGRAKRTLLLAQINRLTDEVQVLQGLINEGRRMEAEELIARLGPEAVSRDSSNSVLAREMAVNTGLSETLLKTTHRLNAITQQNLEARQFIDNLKRSNTSLDELIDSLDGGLLLARILRQQRDTLPAVHIDDNLSTEIAELRLYEFELSQQLEQLANPDAHLATLMAKPAGKAAVNGLEAALREVLAKRQELLNRVQSQLNALLNEAINLQLNQRAITVTAKDLQLKIEQQLFWIPSNRPLDLDWLAALPARLTTQLSAPAYGEAFADLGQGIVERPLLFGLLLVFAAALVASGGWLRRRLSAINRDIGFVARDSQRHTPVALAINLLYAIPGALLLAMFGEALIASGKPGVLGLAGAFREMGLIWLVFNFCYLLLTPGGVARVHFLWPEERCRFLRRRVRDLGLLVLVLRLVSALVEFHSATIGDDALGLVVVLVCYGLLAALLPGLVWKREHPISALRLISAVVVAAIPLALAGAVMAGYYYTALKLTARLTDTLCLLLLWRVAEATLVRGLSLAAQRLEYARAVKKRDQDNPLRDSSESQDVVEQPVLDIDQVNQQSLRLMRLALLSLFAVLLWWLWADLITLFSYLDTVVLYEYSSGSGDTQTLHPISLQDVAGALLIVIFAIIMARNIPGLLEVTVLSRLNLAQGAAYATTTLLSYIIFSIGFVSTLSALGVSWDKLQWLVAALSVGLGFGLQEIFANFVSGIIILFERPVRIGDVVTVGNLSGTVSSMRIRATTITDFDRKEIIVPNKVFVTEQLINWSLTDTITRVTIRVGVAYGSDLNKTRELLLQAAADNPRVLKEPAPMVLFLAFGASTLDHELRVHVRELIDRNMAIDEINRTIDRLFKEHQISIAFNQLDVHFIRAGREQPREESGEN